MMRKKGKDNKAHAADEDVSKQSVQTPPESVTCLTFDDYQCTGNVQVDFPKLCALLDIKNIPPVYSKTTEEGNEPQTTTRWSKPYLHVDLKNKSLFSCKGLRIIGWKVDEEIWLVLNKMVHQLSRLQSLYFWQAELTDEMVMSLSNTLSLGGSLTIVYLEGNPLPKHSYHLLLSEHSVVTHLFLRNNQIGEEGARLIGSALSTAKTANKNLLFLNLAFNCIGDAGAAYIAQGLRFNRALIYLSLANNQIGDSGAAHLSEILGEFPLTHEEVVERRRLLVEKIEQNLGADFDPPEEGVILSGNNSPAKPEPKAAKKKEIAKKEKKPEKGPANKENPKKGPQKRPKTPEKSPPAKGGKAVGKKKPAPVEAAEEKTTVVLAEPEVEIVNPLLDPLVYCKDGQVFQPGNSTLVYLSLAGNAITEKSLPLFLSSLEQQRDGGLLRLCLNRNHFSPNCELLNKVNQLLQLRVPNNKPQTKPAEEEEHK